MRFLVTGLPRSRTAWFAVVTGAPHELISREGYRPFDKLSDSGAGLHLKRILAEQPCRTLIVERDREDVLQSIERYMQGRRLNYPAVEAYLDQLTTALWIDHPLIKRVRFDELDKLSVMRGALAWLGENPP